MPKRNRELVCLICLVFLLASSFININSLANASSTQIYWGAWVGDSHIGNYNLLTTFESQVGKGVSIWNWIQLWNRPQDSENIPNFDFALMDQCRNHGAIPMVSWGPEGSDGSVEPAFVNLQDVVNGNWDSYLTAWGEASASWGHPYFVRLFWEFTGSWNDANGINPWSNGNTPALFVEAWQHVVNTVRNAGGTQISWVWCTGNVGDSQASLTSVYPGDSYVDWVGTDVYPRAGESFTSTAGTELTNIETVSGKPVMIPELGYIGSDSATWWSNFLSTLSSAWPSIKAVVIWEMPSASLTVVDSGTLTNFKQAISSSDYTSNTYSSLDVSPLDALPLTPAPSTTPIPIVIVPLFNSSLWGIVIVACIFIISSTTLFIVIDKKHKKRAIRKTFWRKRK